jgi:hypothetical protein
MSRSRKATFALLAGASLTFTAAIANAKDYPLHMENDLVAVCTAIKNDSRLALNRAIKNTGLRFSELNAGLVCNGQDMLTFSLTHNATQTNSVIARNLNGRSGILTAKR